MCGIWAFIPSSDQSFDKSKLYKAFNEIRNRGPDRNDFSEFEAIEQLFVGFHRLAIMGTNVSGDQPFKYQEDNKIVNVICNGEIYNYRDLIAEHELEVVSESDCEVLPLLYKKYGFEKMIDLLNGEFAVVVFEINTSEQTLSVHMARDPLGVRPMFQSDFKGGLMLSSELKGLLGENKKPVKPGRIYEYMFRYTKGKFQSMKKIVDKPYTDLLTNIVRNPLYTRENLELIFSEIRESFTEAVSIRLHSDRPLGCLLSGGLDSSLVAAVAARELKKQGKILNTFSIGMKDSTDEYYARKVAEHIGSNHTHYTLTNQDFLDAIEIMPWVTETFDITTQRATTGQYLVCKKIAETTDIKVLLVGDGSDELACGYRYVFLAPDHEAAHDDTVRLLDTIYMFDVLRADRGISFNGLEGRVPFLDKNFVKLVLSIDPSLRVPIEGREKWLFRKAFDVVVDGTPYLPHDVLFRPKEAFSDGVSSQKDSWHDIVKAEMETLYTKEDLSEADYDYTHCIPISKEALHYRKKFHQLFPGASVEDVLPYFWMPRWSDVTDPSARELDVY